jgi:hypothetical protein
VVYDMTYGMCDLNALIDPGNLLVDPDTGAIVGVVDFELSHVGLASDEFLNGLVQLGTFHPGPYDDESPEYSLALLAPSSGFADDIPLEGPGAGNADWSTARLVEAALGKQDVLRPRTIDGFEAASRLYWFMDAICPYESYALRSLRTNFLLQVVLREREVVGKGQGGRGDRETAA